MSKLLEVFKFEFKRSSRRRGYLFMTLGVPLVAILILFGVQAYQTWQASRPPDANAAEQDQGNIEKIGYVDASGLFPDTGVYGIGNLITRYDSEDAAAQALASGEIDTYYVIPADYLENGTVTRYAIGYGLDNFGADGTFQSFMASNLLTGVDPNLIRRLSSDIVVTEHRLSAGGDVSDVQSEGNSFIMVYLFSLLLIFATFFSSGYLMQAVLEEKETRMVEIILSALRPLPLLAGKVLAAGLLGLIQIVLWAGAAIFILSCIGSVAPALAGIQVDPLMLVWMLLYFVLSYLMIGGLYAAIAAIAPSMREGPQMAVVITLPAMLPLYFTSVFADTPNAILPVILSFFPLTAPMSMIQRLAVVDVPVIEVVISLVLLALGAAGAIWLAGRLFRVNTLLAGQMPKWRDLLRVVREG